MRVLLIVALVGICLKPARGRDLAPLSRAATSKAAKDRAAKELAKHQNPKRLTQDQTHLYWIGFERGNVNRIARVAKTGGPVQVLAREQKGAYAIAVDREYVYWTNYYAGEEPDQGSIRRVRKTGGAVEVLARDQRLPAALAVDETSIYWTNSWEDASGQHGLLLKLDKAGGVPKIAADRGLSSPRGVVVTPKFVYVYGFIVGPGRGYVSAMSKTGGPMRQVMDGHPIEAAGALGDDLIIVDDGTRLFRISPTSGATMLLLQLPWLLHPSEVAFTPEGLYSIGAEKGAGAVMRGAFSSSPPKSLVRVIGPERGPIIVDDHYVFWASGKENDLTLFRIDRKP